jgi:NADH:ubiquinone oxidoreductase subunit 2 (subunit N)
MFLSYCRGKLIDALEFVTTLHESHPGIWEYICVELFTITNICLYWLFMNVLNYLILVDLRIFSEAENYYVHLEFIKSEMVLFAFISIFLISTFISYNTFNTNKKFVFLPAIFNKYFICVEVALYFIFILMFLKYITITDFLFNDYFSIRFIFNYLCAFDLSIFIVKFLVVFLFIVLNKFLKYQFSVVHFVKKYIVLEKHFLLLCLLFFIFFLLSSSDFNLTYLCLEAITFILSLFIAFNYDKVSIQGAVKYFSLSAVASGFLILGSALIYGSIYVTDYFHIKLFFYSYHFDILLDYVFLGFFLIVLGFLFKLSLYPGTL